MSGAFQNDESEKSPTGMGDTEASKQSGVKGFGKIAKVECDSMSRDV
jgi:hypothetical protein